uniref:Uncharacterized protein n=1 Tax=Tanacetum cinerariifolium TaxID=118510 RepID=A0A699HFC9_TANCI|nr:hypothetical protein [Tanacetum cinerariifolium]
MLAIQSEEGKGSGHPFEPQPPSSFAQRIHEEQIPTIDASVERATTTAASLDAAQDSGNILKTQSMTMPNVPLPQGIGTGGSPRCQETMGVPLLRLGIDGSMNNIVKQGFSLGERLKLDKEEDSSKQGKMIEGIDQDTGITLVTPTKVSSQEDHPEDQLEVHIAAKVLANKVNTYTRRRRAVSTGNEGISTASVKDKGKSIMQEYEQPKKIKKKVQIQMSLNKELAQKLYKEEQARFNVKQEAKFNAEEEELLTSKTNNDEANPSVTNVDWDDVQAQIQKDKELTQKMLEEERESLSITERVKLLAKLIDNRKKLQATQTKRAGLNLQEESSKRQKTKEGSESTKEPKADDISQEDLQQIIMVVPVEEVYVEALQDLVKETFSTTKTTDDKEKALWVKLKRLFNPNNDDILWKFQRYMHDPLVWRLYDIFGAHHVSTEKGHDIFMLDEKEYPLTQGIMIIMMANKLRVD